MTQEEKELLLKDLCARLPYGIKFLRESWNYEWDQELSVIEVLEDIDKDGYINNTKVYCVEDIKPYLRPTSSMTEEEEVEFNTIWDGSWDKALDYSISTITEDKNSEEIRKLEIIACLNAINWLNAHHFDYQDLIGKGLALEAPEGMYK